MPKPLDSRFCHLYGFPRCWALLQTTVYISYIQESQTQDVNFGCKSLWCGGWEKTVKPGYTARAWLLMYLNRNWSQEEVLTIPSPMWWCPYCFLDPRFVTGDAVECLGICRSTGFMFIFSVQFSNWYLHNLCCWVTILKSILKLLHTFSIKSWRLILLLSNMGDLRDLLLKSRMCSGWHCIIFDASFWVPLRTPVFRTNPLLCKTKSHGEAMCSCLINSLKWGPSWQLAWTRHMSEEVWDDSRPSYHLISVACESLPRPA